MAAPVVLEAWPGYAVSGILGIAGGSAYQFDGSGVSQSSGFVAKFSRKEGKFGQINPSTLSARFKPLEMTSDITQDGWQDITQSGNARLFQYLWSNAQVAQRYIGLQWGSQMSGYTDGKGRPVAWLVLNELTKLSSKWDPKSIMTLQGQHPGSLLPETGATLYEGVISASGLLGTKFDCLSPFPSGQHLGGTLSASSSNKTIVVDQGMIYAYEAGQTWIWNGTHHDRTTVVSTNPAAGTVLVSGKTQDDIILNETFQIASAGNRGMVLYVAMPTSGITGTPALSVKVMSSSNIQTLTTSGTVTSGTFTLTFTDGGSQVTGNIAFNASASAVQSALWALSNIADGEVVCTGGPLDVAPVVCTFTGARYDTVQPVLVVTGAGLVGGGTVVAAGDMIDVASSTTSSQNGGVQRLAIAGPIGQFVQIYCVSVTGTQPFIRLDGIFQNVTGRHNG